MKVQIHCDMCGKAFEKYECCLTPHNFCSRECLADFSSKDRNPEGYATLKDFTKMGQHFSELNRRLNPTRMTEATKQKLREAHLNSGEGKTYTKRYGRHEHRVVAEEKLGRELLPGEVVHHIDGNKRNNDPRNIMVFESQAQHAKFHAELRWFIKQIEILDEGGDAQ